jgi:hypothetical protein
VFLKSFPGLGNEHGIFLIYFISLYHRATAAPQLSSLFVSEEEEEKVLSNFDLTDILTSDFRPKKFWGRCYDLFIRR